MDSPLDSFIANGTLPFTGRRTELERLVAFHAGTVDADGLRAFLLTGEPGAGKSRLVDELVARVAGAGGSTVRVRLYPDTAVALGPILARAIFAGPRDESSDDERLEAGLARLRRHAQLRPTLLIVEDVHLLVGPPVAELRDLVEAIADDPLSLLLVTRIGAPAAAVAERFVVDEIALAGLDRDDVAGLWRAVTGRAIDEALLDEIIAITGGAPIAVRSALRVLLRSGASGARLDPSRSTVDPAHAALRAQVRYLTDGMTAHLDDEQRAHARRLASVGEVFAIEAARAAVGDAGVERLIERGIIAPAGSATPPLAGSVAGASVFRFTHTLLHRAFLEDSNVDAGALVALLADNTPLYSALPFRLLAELGATTSHDAGVVIAAVGRAIALARSLDGTSDWPLATSILDAAARIAADHWSRLDDPVAIETELLRRRLELARRDDESPLYAERVAELLAATAARPDLAEACIAAHAASYRVRAQRGEHAWIDLWEAVGAIVVERPSSAAGEAHLMFLRDSIVFAAVADDATLWRLAADTLERLLDSADAETHRRIVAIAGGQLVTCVETPRDLEHRLAILDELESLFGADDLRVLLNRCALLEAVGRYRELLTASTRALEICRQQGMRRSHASYAITRLHALLQLGGSLDDAFAVAHDCCDAVDGETRGRVRGSAGARIAYASAFRGELAGIERALDELLGGHQALDPTIAWLLDRWRADTNESPSDGTLANRTVADGTVADGTPRAPEGAIVLADDALEAIAALDAMRGDDGAREVLERVVTWLTERGLGHQLRAIIERHRGVLPRRDERAISERARELVRTSRELVGGSVDADIVRVMVVGTVAVARGAGEAEQVRGARLRTLLGLMVADTLQRERLTHREFCRIVSDRELEPEKARKTMNVAVLRLREVVGRDVIVTDDETPRLAPGVEVDLVTLVDRLGAAERAVRNGALLRARPALGAALEIASRGVVYPSLYDEFFEGAREEIEARLRAVAIRTTRALLEARDAEAAVALVGRALVAMPGDEELLEILGLALRAAGRITESVRHAIAAELDDEP